MKVRDTRVYQGPNLYANFRVIRMTVDLGPLEAYPSAKIPGFVDGLLGAMPTLAEHGCSYGEPGGFVRRLQEDGGTWLGHVFEHVALELQNLAGVQVSFGKTRGADAPGVYHVVYEYQEPQVGREAGELALHLLRSLVPSELWIGETTDEEFDFLEELEHLIRRAQRRAFGPSTASLIRAAEARDIPWLRLNQYSLVQFGHGKHQRRIQATITSETRHIGVSIASDKEETRQILHDLGLPVPEQMLVYGTGRAVRAARRIGYPVVVKPLDANHGRGVSIGMDSDEAVAAAFEQARKHSRGVLVESFLKGFDHRMLVINGELVAASKRVPGHVVGDGKQTIAQLIEEVNSDPRRGIGHEKVLTRLELDHQAERLMRRGGVTEDVVLPAGQVFYLRSTANLSTGGTAVDVTDIVHPDNREMAVRAAVAIGLDVAGVDFLTDDISTSWMDSGGGICEVNAAPGFRMHVAPSEGTPRDAAGPVIDMLFPQEAPSRIPIAAVTGTNGKTTTTRMLAHIHKLAGETVGMSSTDGVYVDGTRTVIGDMTGPMAAQMVLRDPRVSVAVLETARGGLLRAGMGYSGPNVACCLNVAADHLGLRGIDTLEQLAAVKRIPIEAAKDAVVLNADDPLVLSMSAYTNASKVVYVTTDPRHELVREHIRAGGCAVSLESGVNGEMIVIYEGGSHMPLLWTHLIPATLEGKAAHNVQNAMFAAAMAFCMDVRLEDIRLGLRTFDTSFFQAPGRLNVFDELGFKVILDYGHNPAAVSAMCDLVDAIADGGNFGRKIGVIAAPGDRRDEDVRAIAKRAAKTFDVFFCKRDDRLRGRGKAEIPELLAATLRDCGVDDDAIMVIPDEREALGAALAFAEAGDLMLAFGDDVTRCWKQIIYYGGRGPAVSSREPVNDTLVDDAGADVPLVTMWQGVEVLRDADGGVRLARQDDND
ncbi:MAG: cyanophycin synthetase [Myxococcales bacterium]|nr:cyanophycin synthetase [Myxococcales bacterium]